ncbi:MAG TPA: peptide deformylase [Verrucomicrobiae bacterium]|nr:peptide deformylase [Verrucomicrobiae bacterium]
MALLPILHHPDPRLRQKAKPVAQFDAALRRLVADMFETMYAAPGVGLAATQVGIPQRVAVMDCSRSEDKREPMVFVNPEILESAEPEEVDEGCLSVPGVSDNLKRFRRVKARALDEHGKPFEVEAEGLLAQCIQHEIDHLDGKLYIDRLSSLKRERLLKRLKEERDAGKDERA